MLKKSVIINKNKIRLPEFVNNKMIILVALFSAGVIIGVTTYNNVNKDFASSVKTVFEEYINLRLNSDILNCFLYSFVIYFAVPLLIILFGLGVIGNVLVYSFPFILGGISSFYLTFIIKTYAAKGFAYIALIVLPSFAFAVASVLFLCTVSLNMSSCITKLLMTQNSEKTMTVKTYLKNCAKYISAVIVSCILNCCGFKLFYDMILII